MDTHWDIAVIGGGVIGLSIAYELSRVGKTVIVFDQRTDHPVASWAGAGILPPFCVNFGETPLRLGEPNSNSLSNRLSSMDKAPSNADWQNSTSQDRISAICRSKSHSYDQLGALGYELHREWATRLLQETGIDNGYRRCGGFYFASSAGEQAALIAYQQDLISSGFDAFTISSSDLNAEFSFFRTGEMSDSANLILCVPDEAQIRNPWHLRALKKACQLRGVEVLDSASVTDIDLRSDRVGSVATADASYQADQFCFTAGAWSHSLLTSIGIDLPVFPMRGQMLLYQFDEPPFSMILNQGSRYVVPRDDGHVLVGSTEEETGFDASTTDEGTALLESFAQQFSSEFHTSRLKRTWAGLRPASFDGQPYLSRIAPLENAFLSTGHFRGGIMLSTATATLMRQLMLDETPWIDLVPFSLNRI